MKIVYLLPLSLSSTQHVSDIVYLKKRVAQLMLTTLDLWKSRGIERAVFYNESEKSIPRHRDRQRSR